MVTCYRCVLHSDSWRTPPHRVLAAARQAAPSLASTSMTFLQTVQLCAHSSRMFARCEARTPFVSGAVQPPVSCLTRRLWRVALMRCLKRAYERTMPLQAMAQGGALWQRSQTSSSYVVCRWQSAWADPVQTTKVGWVLEAMGDRSQKSAGNAQSTSLYSSGPQQLRLRITYSTEDVQFPAETKLNFARAADWFYSPTSRRARRHTSGSREPGFGAPPASVAVLPGSQ
jgi:hypothetical protein